MDPEPDEIELARRPQAGDREALKVLLECLRPGLFALAYSELRHYEEAQDAVASALLQICRHVGDLRDPALARAWIWSIARNEARLILRRRAQRREELATERVETIADTGSVGGGTVESDLRLEIERALRRLPRDQARAVALHYLAGLPVEEIARRCDRAALVPAPAVYEPGGLTCQIDDFRVADPGAWEEVGSALLRAVGAWARAREAVQFNGDLRPPGRPETRDAGCRGAVAGHGDLRGVRGTALLVPGRMILERSATGDSARRAASPGG
jgi:RNA polymerase sigma-70 factor (ECF subfamily)